MYSGACAAHASVRTLFRYKDTKNISFMQICKVKIEKKAKKHPFSAIIDSKICRVAIIVVPLQPLFIGRDAIVRFMLQRNIRKHDLPNAQGAIV